MKKVLVYFLFALVSCGESISPQDFQAAYDQSLDAYGKQYYGQTLEYTAQALHLAQSGSDSAQLYYLQYLSHFNLADQTAAGIQLQLAIHFESEPSQLAKYYSALCHFYISIGSYKEANEAGKQSLEYLSAVNDLELVHNYYLRNALRGATEIKDFERAKQILDQVDDSYLTPVNKVQFLAARIYFHYQRKEYLKAVEIANGYLESLSDLSELDLFWVYNNLGLAYAALDKHDVAQNNYRQALRYRPNHPITLFNQVRSYKKQGEVAKMLAVTESLTDLLFSHIEPTYYNEIRQAYRLQYQALMELGRSQEALAIQDQAYAFDLKATEAIAETTTRLTEQLADISEKKTQVITASQQNARVLSLERHNSLLIYIILGVLLLMASSVTYLLRRMRYYRLRRHHDEADFNSIREVVDNLEGTFRKL